MPTLLGFLPELITMYRIENIPRKTQNIIAFSSRNATQIHVSVLVFVVNPVVNQMTPAASNLAKLAFLRIMLDSL